LKNTIGKVIRAQFDSIALDINNIHAHQSQVLLTHGQDDMKRTFSSILGTGEWWGDSLALTAEFQAAAEREFYAQTLATLWGLSRVYMVLSNAPDGCTNDDRGALEVRICLPEYPKKVLYIYSLGYEREKDISGEILVQAPPGIQVLDGIKMGGLTKEDLARAALFTYQIQRGEKFEDPALYDRLMQLDYRTPSGRISPKQIPICFSPNGESISSINEQFGRNYPCMCGDFSWDDWSKEKDESHAFLNKTGLYMSSDFSTYCLGPSKGRFHRARQGCKQDETHHYDWAGKDVVVESPFTNCMSKQHIVKGYTDSSDDGTVAHCKQFPNVVEGKDRYGSKHYKKHEQACVNWLQGENHQ